MRPIIKTIFFWAFYLLLAFPASNLGTHIRHSVSITDWITYWVLYGTFLFTLIHYIEKFVDYIELYLIYKDIIKGPPTGKTYTGE